jgi:5-enolpyruvylshikimate-3-phosphate synthase
MDFSQMTDTFMSACVLAALSNNKSVIRNIAN